MNVHSDVTLEVALNSSNTNRREHYKALLERHKSMFKDTPEGIHVAKPKISDVVAHLDQRKAFDSDSTKARSKMSYRGYKRNMAKKMRKWLA